MGGYALESEARSVTVRHFHSHTHYHDGHAHTHWHSHDGDEDHPAPDPEGDHHEEIGGHDHDEPPFFPDTVRTTTVRDNIGKFLATGNHSGDLCQLEPPPSPPPKPPPSDTFDKNFLHRLRTVILVI
jgi:hypothetical protein